MYAWLNGLASTEQPLQVLQNHLLYLLLQLHVILFRHHADHVRHILPKRTDPVNRLPGTFPRRQELLLPCSCLPAGRAATALPSRDGRAADDGGLAWLSWRWAATPLSFRRTTTLSGQPDGAAVLASGHVVN